MSILKVEHISKTYHSGQEEIKALQDVSLVLEKGEILAVMGSSGSGKSTLLHILGALDQPEEGRIYLGGVLDIEIMSLQKMVS